ncbi:arabinogalactan O-methyltransferase 2-like [Coffea arabica]|uniref:Arabinogalactan O-methyltransferase 2-like n=1 Tax=Coffea arabica TaxID=13443 RepID=A0A6P6SE63_COFAR|nr:glucuronoxylan 4-O-methyltransferase 3-like [Coffea arabica]
MPPEVSPYSPQTPLLSPISTKSRQLRKSQLHHKFYKGEGKMNLLNKKKLIPLLVCILLCASVFRLLKITIVTSSTTRLPLSLSPVHLNNVSYNARGQEPSKNHSISHANSNNLTEKEMGFLLNLISHKSPCNLLVFGQEHQYSVLASTNTGGMTIFLEDDPEKLSTITTANNTLVYKLKYPTLAKDAYKLLKHARKSKKCSPSSGLLKQTKCKLALKNLPKVIYELKWDVVLVDGPCGHRPLCPGRMASIYTASLLARENHGNVTNVVVHDIDRMIEKWFSWEFLCENNLVSSKGKFWNFGIQGESNATTFCSK